MYLAQGPQLSDALEAHTRGHSVSSQALYHWATALPTLTFEGGFCAYAISNKISYAGPNDVLYVQLNLVNSKSSGLEVLFWTISSSTVWIMGS